jgi:glutaminase
MFEFRMTATWPSLAQSAQSALSAAAQVAAAMSLLLLPVLAHNGLVAAEAEGAAMYQAAVDAAYAQAKDNTDGANADYIPALAEVPSELFGVAVVTADGTVATAGDVDHAFSIQSVSKPFTMALVMEQQGVGAIREQIGVEPTGQAFNSIMAIEMHPARSINPLVNAGAIAAVSMIEAPSAEARWKFITDGFAAYAGSELPLLQDIYESEAATNQRNTAISYLLQAYGRLYADPLESVDVYTKQCSLGVNCQQLAMMGATLANGGVHPTTGTRVLREEYVDEVLAVMMMAGFYDESGVWAYEVGLPGKTGVGGGIVVVVSGELAIAAFSPRLNTAGNSIRAMQAIRSVAHDLGVDVFKD